MPLCASIGDDLVVPAVNVGARNIPPSNIAKVAIEALVAEGPQPRGPLLLFCLGHVVVEDLFGHHGVRDHVVILHLHLRQVRVITRARPMHSFSEDEGIAGDEVDHSAFLPLFAA
jgi:hypothetical protein